MMKYIFALMIVFEGGVASADDGSILFSSKELDAAFTLVRPELNTLDISGRSGTLDPAPALKYLGVAQQKFDINLNGIADIVDIEFNHIRNKPFQVQFQDQGIQLTIPLEDQVKAIHSTLGSISFKDVTLIAVIGVSAQSNGDQLVVVKDVMATGQMSGTGILKSKLIMKKARQLLVSFLSKELSKLLSKGELQVSIKKGLLTWSKFYSGNDYKSLVPGSILMNREGIHFQAQW